MKRPKPRALLLDMDGLLFHGDRPLPGARALLERFDATPHAFVTNNPIRTPEEVADSRSPLWPAGTSAPIMPSSACRLRAKKP